jgi:hypothetical protein
VRQALRHRVFERVAGRGPGRRAADAEQRRADEPGGEDGADAWDEEARDDGPEMHPAGDAERPADRRAQRRAHARLLGLGRRHLAVDLALRRARREQADALVTDAGRVEILDGALGLGARTENACDSAHASFVVRGRVESARSGRLSTTGTKLKSGEIKNCGAVSRILPRLA